MVSRHLTQWRDASLHFPMTSLEFYFITIPLEISWVSRKTTNLKLEKKNSSKQHKFLMKCVKDSHLWFQSWLRSAGNWKGVCTWDFGCSVSKEARAAVAIFFSNYQMHRFQLLQKNQDQLDANVSTAFHCISCCLHVYDKWYESSWSRCSRVKSKSTFSPFDS